MSVGGKEREFPLPGDRVAMVFHPTRRRWSPSYHERRLLVLGPRDGDRLRPTVASGDIVDGTVVLDDGNVLDAEVVQQIEKAVQL